jgi:hypothetical protein
MSKQSQRPASSRDRSDGRKSFLVYLPKELITDLKVAALGEGRPAYLITEQAIRSYLGDKRSRRKRRL